MTAYYNEIDPEAAEWLRNLIKAGLIAPGDVDNRSIEDVRPSDLAGYAQCHFFAGIGVWSYALRSAGWSDDRRVWTGSCPCQPFSVAGKGAGVSDERHLWPAWFHLIKECRPDAVFGEQVEAAIRHGWLDLVQTDLEGIGYACGPAVLPAAGFGAPHGRHRLWFVADAVAYTCIERRRIGEDDARRVNASEDVGRGTVSGVGDVERVGLEGHAGDVNHRPKSGWINPHSARPVAAPGPVNGFWSDAGWLPCTDGKARAVESKFIALFDGSTTGLVSVCTSEYPKKEKVNAISEKTRPREILCCLPNQAQQGALQRGARDHELIPAPEVLQSDVHGGRAGSGGGHQPKPQQDEGPPAREGSVRSMWQSKQTSCAPQGREPAEQYAREFADFVRLLPSTYALAKLCGDTNTTEALSALLEGRSEDWFMQHASDSAEAVWRSLPEEAQDGVRVGFDSGQWVRVPVPPLVNGAPSRLVRLRAYGNSIVAPVAEEVIRAYMEVCSAQPAVARAVE